MQSDPPDFDPNAVLEVSIRVLSGDQEHEYSFNALMGSLEWTTLGFLWKQGYDPARVEFEIYFDDVASGEQAVLLSTPEERTATVIRSRHAAGESIEELAEDYEMQSEDIQDIIDG